MLSIPKEAEKYVRASEKNFLLEGERATVFTYTVLPTDEKGNLPKKKVRYGVLEDNTYLHHPETRVVYRGCSDLVLPDDTIVNLRGLEKFTGTFSGDEDEENGVTPQVVPMIDFNLLKDLQEQQYLSVSFQEKANGKMAIFTVFVYKDKPYIFGGSKNVHVVVPLLEDVPEVARAPESELHYRILSCIQKDLQNRGKSWLSLVGLTIVGEYVDGCHIVYTPSPYMVYFTEGMDLPEVKHLLPTQDYLPTQDQLDYLRNLSNTEGCVIVYKDTFSGAVWRQKHKTKEYIILRVIREALCKKKDEENAVFLAEMAFSRVKDRSDSFLNLSEEELLTWQDKITAFVAFMKSSQSMYSFRNLSFSDSIGMARIWHEFQDSHPRKDVEREHPERIEREHPEFLQQTLLYPTLINSIGHLPVCFILQGLPGSGKSTTCQYIEELCKKRQLSFAKFSTDDLWIKDGVYTFDKTKLGVNHAENYRRFCESKANVVCVDNTNTTEKEYAKYVSFARNQGRLVVILSTLSRDVDMLVSRNIHFVGKDIIQRMNYRMKYARPSYYGAFFRREDIVSEVIQADVTTPLHITFNYSREIDYTFLSLVGKIQTFSILGMKTSKAGKCLLVTLTEDQKRLYKNRNNPHITLAKKKGYRSQRVCTKILDFIPPLEVRGMYGVMFWSSFNDRTWNYPS